jgi:hypothetical protein
LRRPGAGKCTTLPERNMIARRRWLGAEPSKSLGLIVSAQISASLNSGKIRSVGLQRRWPWVPLSTLLHFSPGTESRFACDLFGQGNSMWMCGARWTDQNTSWRAPWAVFISASPWLGVEALAQHSRFAAGQGGEFGQLRCKLGHAVQIEPGLRPGSPENGNISNICRRLSTISLPQRPVSEPGD